MRRLALAGLAILFTGLPLAVEAQSLDGAWRPVEVEVMGGPNAGTTDVEADGSLWVFSDGHFSVNAISPNAVRPDPSDDPTRQERSRLFRTYLAFAGTYELEGSTLTLEAEVQLDPARPSSMTREITLTDSTLETRETGSDDVVTVRRYVRLD